MWVDGTGNVLSRSFPGAYGEDLGIYKDRGFTKLGFAGLQDEHNEAGAFYTPNRMLGTTGRFLSADPSGTFSLGDPRTFNQYTYVVQNPLLFRDPAGLGWGEDFAEWMDSNVDAAMDDYAKTNAGGSATGYFALGCVETVAKWGTDTFRLGEGAYASYDAASRGEYLEAGAAALQDVGRACNVMLVGAIAGKILQAASQGTRLGAALNSPLSQLARGTEAEAGAFNGSQLGNTWGHGDLMDHFGRHGAYFGAKSADEYADMASVFLQRSQATGLPTKVDANGVIRVYEPATNTFGSYNPNGTTKTFFKPDPAIHGYATNMDYWIDQRGVAP